MLSTLMLVLPGALVLCAGLVLAAGFAHHSGLGSSLLEPARFAVALWYLVSVAGFALGAASLLKALEGAILAARDPQDPPCVPGRIEAPCSEMLPATWHNALTGIALVFSFGVAFFAVRRLARWAGIRPLSRRFSLTVAAVFFPVSLFLTLSSPATSFGAYLWGIKGDMFGVRQAGGLWPSVIGGATAALVAIAAMVWYLFGSRQQSRVDAR